MNLRKNEHTLEGDFDNQQIYETLQLHLSPQRLTGISKSISFPLKPSDVSSEIIRNILLQDFL